MDRKKNIVTKIFIGVLLVTLLATAPMLGLLGSGIAIWYFAKKSPNKRYRNYSVALAVISLLAFGVTTGDPEAESQAPDQSVAVVESKASSEESAEKEGSQKKKQEEEKKAKTESESKTAKEKAEAESKAKAESIAKAESVAKVEAEKAESEAVAKQESELEQQRAQVQTSTPSVPAGNTYVEVNGNVPLFTNADISSTEAWEDYGDLDHLGRVTVANAVLGVELMPAEERGDISDVYPTGWNQEKYSVVSGGWLYNRSHLLGHQLTGEDANVRNLISGTRWFNTEGMLPFENFVANYVETTENHVRYRVTPHFEGDNLLASGVYMEGLSIEDNGAALKFHIYVPNIQPGVNLDYTNGSSWVDVPEVEVVEEPVVVEDPVVETAPEVVEQPVEVPQQSGDVSSVDTNGNGQVTIKEAKEAGFSMPITSDHWLYQYMDDRDGDGQVGE